MAVVETANVALLRTLTASQLERAVRAYRQVTAAEADGSLVVRARLAPEDGALFVRALEAARDRLQERVWREERGSAEPRRPSAAEALVALADTSLAADDGRPGGERYQVVVHVEASGRSARRRRLEFRDPWGASIP